MMRTGLTIVLAAMTLAATAMATDNVWVIVDHLAPDETKERTVELTAGKTTVEVVPINASNKANNITCELDTGSDAGAGIEQDGVEKCLFNLDTPSNGAVYIKTTNNEDKDIEYRILVHETEKTK